MNGENDVAIPYSALSNSRIEEIKAVVEKKRPKVAIYCRLSQEDRNKKTKEDDSESIKNQKIMLEKYANRQNWEIYGIYSDDDYTETDRNRPGFNEVIRLAQEKKFDIGVRSIKLLPKQKAEAELLRRNSKLTIKNILLWLLINSCKFVSVSTWYSLSLIVIVLEVVE